MSRGSWFRHIDRSISIDQLPMRSEEANPEDDAVSVEVMNLPIRLREVVLLYYFEDMNTNEIISYDLALSPNLEQIKRMLDGAFKKFPHVDGLIFHSDQGWQYQHQYFRKRLEKRHIIQSMSRKGNCYDNCIMETFFGRLKNEMFYGHEKEYTSFEKFSKAMDEYIRYYNNERIQAKTNWMPPVKYRKASSSCA